MLAVLYMLLFLAAGVLVTHWQLPGLRPLARYWIGLCMGLLLMMWLPALVAFVDLFSLRGHLLALLPLAALVALSRWQRDRGTPIPFEERDRRDLKVLLLFVLPLLLLGAYLQYTHNLRPEGGALYVGQSTYGDLPLHTGIITSLRNARFPADYSILPGSRLSYPFLVDSLSTSFMLLGFSLQAALVVPGTLMMALVFFGYGLLALRLAKHRKAAMLALLLVFLNGGLGFLYSFDMAGVSLGSPGNNELQLGTWLDRLRTILQGWYQTPVNHAEFTTYNLRWSNIVADLLVPQRTFLAGWCILLPCLYLLWEAMEQKNTRYFVLLGLMAGALPLVHTHSFLALGLCSAGFLLYYLLHRQLHFRQWLLYGAIAVVLALPQLLGFTFRQAGASEGFLRFQFNWVNNSSGEGLRDGYLWFYLKNIGLPVILLIGSLLEKNPRHLLLYAGAFAIFIPAEVILFQPNEYDNNKLFYVWYALCAIPIADYAWLIWDRLKGLRARPLLGAATLVVFFLSGSLSLAREALSNYQAYSPAQVALARAVEAETPEHSLVLTSWDWHLNPVSALSGRQIVAGPDLWLYWHGLDTAQRKQDIAGFYNQPLANRDILTTYGVDYVLLGPQERALGGDADALDELFPRVYQDEYEDYILYEVPQG